MKFIQSIKPGIPKRYLLFMAALVWTFAGGMLLFKGISLVSEIHDFLWLRMVMSIVGGSIFYILLFSKISLKHIGRILGLKNETPCMFSFFNIKSYLMMGMMITMGVFLRKSGIIPPAYLSTLYITMGIPLSLSAFRFYYHGFNFQRLINR
ncbi:hypothetical protein DMA11_19945 [Marinilabiliaceae bacterium JC017]|nr:hypothetical protein DMA11_19945 [Marinilabiliaceae bacterium JC017]